ncbi:helix-turn-helix domain-containing protein [Scrofimicrobium sp. R131]|uniref:Helix-turn-helix domain-containing protein n=2 Tax=Scrofimicrobium appendicitidis TaxID=3079930 RepID=A0AAU7V6N7_9ACTO
MNGDINVYCDESTHRPNDGKPFMVLGAVVSPVALTKDISHRLVELREEHGLPRDFEIKWNKVSAGKLDFYLDVVDYFFEDDDLELRAVVAPKDGLDHAKFGQSHDDWYDKMMFYLVRNVISSTGRSRIYLDKKDTRGGVKVSKLHDVISNTVYDFDRKKDYAGTPVGKIVQATSVITLGADTNALYGGAMEQEDRRARGRRAMRRISYNPLWKKLVDKGWLKRDLQHKAGISSGTVAKLGRNENVTTAVLVKISEALDCGLSDITEIVEGVEGDSDVKAH